MSRLSGFDMKSPRRRLSIRVQPLRNLARLRAFDISGERSAYIRLFSSKNATPDFGLALKRDAPAKISCFLDFACSNVSVRMKSLDIKVKAVLQNEYLCLQKAIVMQRCPVKEVSLYRTTIEWIMPTSLARVAISFTNESNISRHMP